MVRETPKENEDLLIMKSGATLDQLQQNILPLERTAKVEPPPSFPSSSFFQLFHLEPTCRKMMIL